MVTIFRRSRRVNDYEDETLPAVHAEEKVDVTKASKIDNEEDDDDNSSFTGSRKLSKNVHIRRGLKSRHIQLIGIGGTIGTALFVQIASVLNKGGPASLFIAFTSWCFPIFALTFTTSEMVTQYPVPSPFTNLAGRFFDEAMEVASGWNFFILQSTLVPFEITSITYIIEYWRTDFSPWMVIVPQVVLYIIINSVCPVRYYGEVEFWLSILKVLLIVGLLLFTFITMVGGNPKHDAYGFRYWNNPGAFAEYRPGVFGEPGKHLSAGALCRFMGFAACFSQASYTIAGPDYVSMAAGEAINPRKILPKAYKGVLWRLSCFFMLGTLAMGIVCAYNDPELLRALNSSDSGASGSPYVIAMERLDIPVLPSIVNVGLIISAFSAGNSYFYCASRSLHALAIRGQAPSIFKLCLPNGVPIAASMVVVAFAMLSFLQEGNSANQVLSYIVSLGTPAELANYALMSATYIRFYFAMKAQGIDRKTLRFRSWGQPYLAYFSFFATFSMTWLAGWAVFIKGNWSTTSFVLSYVIIPFDIVVYIVWKLWKKPKMYPLKEIDLVSGLEEVERHEQEEVRTEPPKKFYEKVLSVITGDT